MRRTILITMLFAVIAVVAFGLVGCNPLSSQQLTGVPGSTPKAAADPAKHTICLQNEQSFETQVQSWATANPDQTVPTSLGGLQSAGVINSQPACPNGGTYSWDGTSLTCSVDGHWQ